METLFPDIPTDTKPRKVAVSHHDNRLPLLAAYWAQRYQVKYHQKYIFTYKKDYALFKRLLILLEGSKTGPDPVAQLTDAMDRLFDGKLPWFKGTKTIGSFSKHINHLLTDDNAGSKNGIKPKQSDLDRYRSASRTE